MNIKQNISEIKNNVLTEAISAVDIIDVDVKNPNEEDIQLYIKTNNLNTVNSKKLSEICTKHSTKEVSVSFQVPIDRFSNGKTTLNVDTVCVFITTVSGVDLEVDSSLVFPV